MAHFDLPENRKFRICQFTDIHLEADERFALADKTYALIRQTIRDTKPDLITISGDLAWGGADRESIDTLAEELGAFDIPWAPVLGNHDGERLGDKEEGGRKIFAEFLLNRRNCLFEMGPESVDGWGNYVITVGGTPEKPAWALFMLDSHRGSFARNQVNWYADTSASFGPGHSELAFFHVPIPEYTEVWDYEPCKGFNQERVCATDLNDGLFSAMVRGGAMRGVFVGHDHINDYEGTLHGIRLCYGRGSGYQCYGLEGFAHGARIIDIGAEPDFDTSIYIETGEQYEQKFLRKPKLRRKWA